jgi:glycosyltransferase involved in cell wall biosynthesis
MKLLYVTPGPIPSQAANSVHVMKMAQAFTERGCDVTLSFSSNSLETDGEIFKKYAIKSPFKLYRVKIFPFISRLYFSFKSALFAKESNFNLVFSRCIPTAFISGILGVPFFLEIHDSPNSLGRAARFMFNRSIRSERLCGLVVISNALKDHILDMTGLHNEQILVLHDGADNSENITPSKLPRGQGYSFNAGYTGHLYEGRGIEVIVYLAEIFPDAFFHIIGGREEDVKQWLGKTKGMDNICFYGHVPHNEVASFLLSFDVLLAPYQKKVAVAGNRGDTSRWMSPLKIFEYMASGKPIISSDIPVLKEVLHHRDNAFLCPPEDWDAWKETFSFLRENPGFAKHLGESARRALEEKYTWNARAAQILEYYRSRLQKDRIISSNS